MRRGVTAMLVALAAILAPATAAAVEPKPEPYEDAGDSFRNILPPGSNGTATGPQVAAFLASGGSRGRPPHNGDQLDLYGDLVYESPQLTAGELNTFFKDASFGVPPGDLDEEYQPCGTATDPCDPRLRDHPCAEVTVQRDAGFGVPHIYGGTRDGAMCAAGYVAAEDRLFLVDVLRHAGRAELSEFVGGAEGNREMDREQWSIAPYTEQDLQRQVDQFDELYGAQGRQLQGDLEAYVAGLNQYVFEARIDRVNKMPGEYFALLGQDNLTGGPEDFKETDVVAIASLVGGIFGKGGGSEIESSQFLQAAEDRFGARGEAVWEDFRSAEEPEAPTTVFDGRFPYEVRPDTPAAGSLAIPDPGSVEFTDVVESSTAQAGSFDPGAFFGGLFDLQGAGSNALLVSADESASGNPIAVFGPQTGYFSPQLLMEMDIHGPGLDARGAAFAGTNLYVQLGRGVDYAWSATSAGQDNVDTFALDLCDPGGSGASLQDYQGYVYRGRCRAFEVLRRTNVFTPNPLDPSAGSETLRVNRTQLGLETARGKIAGEPVVYVSLRSTYMHEVDSARGFADFNNPNKIESAADYQRAANKIGYTFNWFYTDDEDIAYFNSGENPERARGIDPNFPVRACPTAACGFEWRGYQPIRRSGKTGNRADYTPFSEHPQVVNQSYLTSWNNKQARGFRANDANFEYHSIYRSIPLDEGIEKRIKGARTISLRELADAMESAGTVDLRGDQVLPWLLEVLEAKAGKQAIATEDEAAARTSAPENEAAVQASAPEDQAAVQTSAAEDQAAAQAIAGRTEDGCDVRRVDTIDEAVTVLNEWYEDGAHRRDANANGRYEHSCAIEIMDAWWPLLVKRMFAPTLGQDAYEARLTLGGIDNEPNNHGAHLGSAYQGGFYGYVEKDVRSVLARAKEKVDPGLRDELPVKGRYSRVYCGGRGPSLGQQGSLARCRKSLRGSLTAALAVPRPNLYDDDEVCDEGGEGEQLEDQYCYDTILQTAAGAITQPLIHWINRPTFQQAVEVQQSVPRDPGGGDPPDGRGGDSPGRDDASGGGDAELGSSGGRGEQRVATIDAGAANDADGGRGGLPFTGLGLLALTVLGVLLLGAGTLTRRRASS